MAAICPGCSFWARWNGQPPKAGRMLFLALMRLKLTMYILVVLK